MSKANRRNTQSDISCVAFYWSRVSSQVLETMTTDQQGAGGDFRGLARVELRLISSGVADSEDVLLSEIVIVAGEVI